jgi:hypothetical protein
VCLDAADLGSDKLGAYLVCKCGLVHDYLETADASSVATDVHETQRQENHGKWLYPHEDKQWTNNAVVGFGDHHRSQEMYADRCAIKVDNS